MSVHTTHRSNTNAPIYRRAIIGSPEPDPGTERFRIEGVDFWSATITGPSAYMATRGEQLLYQLRHGRNRYTLQHLRVGTIPDAAVILNELRYDYYRWRIREKQREQEALAWGDAQFSDEDFSPAIGGRP